jgi:hypothetical protein
MSMVVMSKRLEKRLGRLRQCLPLQSLVEQPLFLYFIFLRRLLSGTPRGGGLYIVVFGQAEHQETKMDDIRASMLKQAWVARPRLGSCHLCSFEPRGPPRWLLMLQKVLVIKYWCPKNPRSILLPEGSWNVKYTKQGFPVLQSYNQNKGDDGNPHKIITKHDYNN